MRLIRINNYNELSEKASKLIINKIKNKPNLTIAFATGKTPLRLYKKLADAYRNGEADFSQIKAFNLDEYYPIKKSDKISFRNYLFTNLFDKINIKENNIILLNGESENPRKECADYEKKIRENPIDIMILGLGSNGHVAFNEPGSKPSSKTRLVRLSKETIKANSTASSKIPEHALTIGISTILSAKKIILLASGRSKADAINHLINKKEKSKPTKNWSLTFLRNHKDLTVIVDKEALSLMS